MSRPQRCRRICSMPEVQDFIPSGKTDSDAIVLTCDEYEMIRLADYLGFNHIKASELMDVSRTTATEIYESAHKKLADALVNGKILKINGGNIRFCTGEHTDCGKECSKKNTAENNPG